MKKKYLVYLQVFAAAAMIIQICLGSVWTLLNFRAVPGFGDTAEYLMLSETLYLDEYRPVLFPLILRVVQKAASAAGIPYQCLLYAMQLTLNICAVCLTVRTVFRLAGIRIQRRTRILIELYILSIPLILWMNCSVLTDSLALTGLLLMLTGLTRYMADDGHPVLNWCLIGASYALQALIRADRQYSCLVLILLSILAKAFRPGYEGGSARDSSRRKKKFILSCMIPLLITSAGLAAVRAVDARTQIPGSNGRIQTNLSFILLDRVVYGHFEENYDRMPEEVTAVISREEARHSDKQNNDCMYILAPRLEEAYGKERAYALEREMAHIVWRQDPFIIIGEIIEDVFCFIFMPFASFLFEIGKADLNKGWTIRCMSSVTGDLTAALHQWFAVSFGLLMTGIIPVLCLLRGEAGKRLPYFSRFIWMTLLIALWFGIGDGCPPNDRYQLIGYVTWTLLAANALL